MTMSAPTLTPPTLLHTLSRYWWLVLLRGIAFIVFGVLAFMWPGLTLVTLVLFYGAFVLVDGVLALAHAIMGGNMGSRWWLALIGVAGIAAGILTFMWPGADRAAAADLHRLLGDRARRVPDRRARSSCARRSTTSGR